MEPLTGICILCSKSQKIVDSQLLKCGHLFHQKCIESWLECRYFCPICRCSMTEENNSVEIFRPSFDTKKLSERSKTEKTKETMEQFFAYKNYEELKSETMEKIQNLWKVEEISQMTPARVFLAAGKSHMMCKRAIKQKKLFDGYYFALRTTCLIQSMEKTSDFQMYYRNYEYEYRELSGDNFQLFTAFETMLFSIFEERKFSDENINELSNIFDNAISLSGHENGTRFFSSLP
uniref:RING-type domain-containing protein n=1 Tax=Panagrolaimus sp. PS1159 TaxID=55785 RepID=A0AC35FHC0_9BILA